MLAAEDVTMGTATLPTRTPLSLDEYLQTSYHPDCDFVDDHLEERPVGEYEHNNLQAALIAWFFVRGPQWNVRVLPEQRTRVGETRVRVPDVCLVPRDAPIEKVRITPPILCIEILSPEDRTSRTVRVLHDYLEMGVEHLWLFDPIDRVALTYTATGLQLVRGARLTLPNSPVYLDLPELFASLD